MMLRQHLPSGASSPNSRNVNIGSLVKLLDSDDKHVESDARQALRYQLDMGNGIKHVVNQYWERGSERALELLCTIKDPHDTALLDIVREMMTHSKKTPAAIILLGQIVQEAPSWVPKIATHDIFHTVLKFINRTHTDVQAEDIAALLFLASLLPHCAVMSELQLKTLFDTFLNACAFLQGKIRDMRHNTNEVDRINVAHLQYAVREYFHTLYGIYPYMLLNHLRCYFRDTSNKEHQAILDDVIVPLLNGVKFHPSLLVMDKERELARERWAQREPHDFLDDCRRVIIGLIPTVNNPEPPQSDSDSQVPVDEIYCDLFASSNGQLTNTQTTGSTSDVQLEALTSSFDLMSLLNTPPGTRSVSPHNRSLNDSSRDAVLPLSRSRQQSGETSKARSLMKKLVKIGRKAISPLQQEKTYEPLIEVLPADVRGDSASGTLSTAEEAEEAFDMPLLEVSEELSGKEDGAVLEEHPTASVQPKTPSAKSKKSVSRLSGEWEGWAETTPENHNRLTRRSDPMVNYMSEMKAARDAARESVLRDRGFTLDETKIHLNDLGEITFSKDAVSSDSVSRTSHEDLEEAVDSPSRSRFSVTAFFKKINRQRFHSECPPGQLVDQCVGVGDSTEFENNDEEHDGREEEENEEEEEFAHPPKSIPRSSSCPNVHELLKRRRSVPGASTVKPATEISYPNVETLMEQFPYLKLMRGPDMSFYGKLERTLERQHEENRNGYMEASRAYHNMLKDLYLADRLPGRIYDDLSHILHDLSPEEQKEVLQARLRLVNQHLLYERSCRLLHANRNRRLYWRMRLQKNLENELARYRENEVEVLREREYLIKALSNMRAKEQKQRIDIRAMTSMFSGKLRALNERVKELEQEEALKEIQIQQLEELVESQSIPFCLGWRKYHDVEACAKITQEELDACKTRIESLLEVQRENQVLRDSVEIYRKKTHENAGPVEPSSRVAVLEHTCSELEDRIALLTQEKDTYECSIQNLEEELDAQRKEVSMLYLRLQRASRQLKEQGDVAEQKFMSLQLVCKQLEAHVTKLYLQIEGEESDPSASEDTSQQEEIFSVFALPEGVKPPDDHLSHSFSSDLLFAEGPDSPAGRSSPGLAAWERAASEPTEFIDTFDSASPQPSVNSLP